MASSKDEAGSLVSSLFGGEEVVKDLLASRMVEKFERSWGMQSREECRRRMTFVLRMAGELEKVRQTTRQSSAWAEWAIEAVITGDLKELKSWGIDGLSEEMFFWNYGSDPKAKELAAAYARFREVAEEAYISALPKETV